ncbi:MAG: hypothetical protein OEY59_02130 [Deltaproteobacteria bacterium]|nr:hypothetical protein [Deltaproteobacteria bacterium]
MHTETTDLNHAIQITEDIFWVGFYDEKADLHCNPYILNDQDDVVFFDPGSIPHFPIVMRKVIELVNPENITVIVIHHQDPDVCGNLAIVEDLTNNPDLRIFTHKENIRLVNHLGLNTDLLGVDANNNQVTLKSGRVLEFIPSPFLHSPFAIVTYDHQSKTLFSSDIFGAESENWNLFASGDFISPMKKWHETTMPSQRHLRAFLEVIEKREINWILPQHGSVLDHKQSFEAIKFLKQLKCGIDL